MISKGKTYKNLSFNIEKGTMNMFFILHKRIKFLLHWVIGQKIVLLRSFEDFIAEFSLGNVDIYLHDIHLDD